MSSGRLPISHVAKLARLELTPEEAETFEAQLDPILAMIEKLREAVPGGGETGLQIPDGLPPLRGDEPHPGLATAAALVNAPAQAREQFSVPRVIDAE